MTKAQDPSTILALHGFTGSGQDFIPLQQTQSGSRFNWICPDFMGHGEQPSPESLESYQLEAALDLIEQARRSAADPDRVILLAYSMGGRIALHYLLKARPMPAFLVGTSPGLKTKNERCARRRQDQKWIDLLSSPDPIPGFCREWESQPLIEPQTRLPQPICGQLAERRRRNNPTGLSNSLLACGTGALTGLWNQVSMLPPIHLIHGEYDAKFAAIANRMNALNSACIPIPIPGCGHAPHLEQPVRLMDSVASRVPDLN